MSHITDRHTDQTWLEDLSGCLVDDLKAFDLGAMRFNP